MVDIKGKRNQEILVVEKMIKIYCRGHNHSKQGLCKECVEVLEYAKGQVNRCPYMEEKTFCSSCKTHCYKPVMCKKIRSIMRYSGPRLIFHHPILTIRHGFITLKNRLFLK